MHMEMAPFFSDWKVRYLEVLGKHLGLSDNSGPENSGCPQLPPAHGDFQEFLS